MATRLLVLLTSALLAAQSPLAFAQRVQEVNSAQHPYWDCPGPWHMWSGGWGFGWIFPAFMLLMVVVGVLFVVRAFGWAGSHRLPSHWGPGTSVDPSYTALQILNERFARGEIQKAEYEEKKATILAR